jgi:hypothetical protein
MSWGCQLEEDKTMKRIEDTEARAREVLDLKKKHKEVRDDLKAREELQ